MSDANYGQGKIVVLSKSRFEILDANELELLQNVKSLNRTLGLTSRLGAYLRELFIKSNEPHVLAMKLAYCCGDFNSCRAKSLAVFIVTKILELVKGETIAAPTDPELKLDALRLILEQKNVAFRDLVIDAFDMKAKPESFIPLLRELIEKKIYKDACQLAQSFKLFEHFTIEDFVIPLCLQDKEPVVEAYLRKNEKSLQEFLRYMDKLLVDDAYIEYFNNFIEQRQIPHARNFSPRSLTRFLNRLLKSSNVPKDVCPNLVLRNLRGTMRYYLAKRFESGGTVSEGWSEMMMEVVGDQKDLQKELIESLYEKSLLDEALRWAKKFDLPKEMWPPLLLSYTAHDDYETAANNSQESDQIEYYKLPRDDMIVIVDNAIAFDAFLSSVIAARIISFDTEWKPSFSFVENGISLLQVATHDKIFILDRIVMEQQVSYFSTQIVEKVFHNRDILKIGFSVGGDVKLLRACFRELNEIDCLLDLMNLRNVLVTAHKFEFPYDTGKGDAGGKLLDLAQLTLGKSLDKTEQCSNWEKRPLRTSQITYAAVDAFCLLDIYDVICSECERQSIPIKEIVQELQIGRSPQRDPTSTVSVKDFRMICTWELCRLVKRLRSCGIDAYYNNAQHPTRQTLKLLKKGYVVLTTVDQPWLRGVRHVRVPIADEKTQLQHILEKYKIRVTDADINTRCWECNKTEFTRLTNTEIRRMQEKDAAIASGQCSMGLPAGFDDEYDDDDDLDDYEVEDDYYERESRPRGVQVEIVNWWTKKGIQIRFGDVPPTVLNQVDAFIVCDACGTVMWLVSFEDLFLFN